MLMHGCREVNLTVVDLFIPAGTRLGAAAVVADTELTAAQTRNL
jgi:hypothetical protein